MAGRPGRSGGQNRMSLAAHVLRGTFRPERHAPLIPPGPPWDPAPALLEALGTAGRAFVTRIRAAYELSALDGELALEGGHAADRLAALRRRKGGSVAARDARAKLELNWQKALTACLLALRARMDRRPAAVPAPVSKWGTGL